MNNHKLNKFKTNNQPFTPELNHHSIHGRRSRALAHALPTLNGRWYSSSQKHAFTIIEVVLVLAIAGLIFLMVFIALPALQRNQRDSLRKNQANTFRDAIIRRVANNRNAVPAGLNLQNWIDVGYLKLDEMKDPSTGELYTPDYSAWGGSLYSNYVDLRPGSYGADTGGYCDGSIPRDITGVDNNASYVFVFALEGGGWACASNKTASSAS